MGSSPLTRGKLGNHASERAEAGLIPAHAGKTLLAVIVPVPFRAHPRSRGKTRGTSKTRCARRAHPRSRGENP